MKMWNVFTFISVVVVVSFLFHIVCSFHFFFCSFSNNLLRRYCLSAVSLFFFLNHCWTQFFYYIFIIHGMCVNVNVGVNECGLLWLLSIFIDYTSAAFHSMPTKCGGIRWSAHHFMNLWSQIQSQTLKRSLKYANND